MAKRFTDTNKYKKPFIRSLPGAYKLLWDFLYHDCDHAGIWIVDFEIAQAYLGSDMAVDWRRALLLFNEDEIRIIEIDGGKKWFIPSFIEFQYGQLSEKNRAHINVITVLKKYDLLDNNLNLKKENKPLTSPLQRAKEKELEKEKEKEQEMEKEGGVGETIDFTKPDVSGDDITMPFETEPMRKLWAAWKEARWRNHGVRYRQFGEQADLRRLQGMTFQQVEQAIQQAIAANWKNLYPEKNGTGKQSTHTSRKKQQSDATAEYLREHYREKLGNK